MLDELPHLTSALADEPDDHHVRVGTADDVGQQGGFADAGFAENPDALSACAGDKTIDGTDTKLNWIADDALTERLGWCPGNRTGRNADRKRFAVDRVPQCIDDAAEQAFSDRGQQLAAGGNTSVKLERPNRSPIGVSTATSSRSPITSAMTRRPVAGSTRWHSSPMRASVAVAWTMTPSRRRTRPLRDRGALSRTFSYRRGRTERRSSILKRSAVMAHRSSNGADRGGNGGQLRLDTGVDDGEITGDDTCGRLERRVALDRHFDLTAQAEAGEFLGDAIDGVRVNRDRQLLLATQISDGMSGGGGDKARVSKLPSTR